jgi:hypothetical protein
MKAAEYRGSDFGDVDDEKDDGGGRINPCGDIGKEAELEVAVAETSSCGVGVKTPGPEPGAVISDVVAMVFRRDICGEEESSMLRRVWW